MNEPGWIFQKFIKKHNLIKSTLFRGGNQDGLKEFNERLIIHVIRNSREITGTDISNLTGISVQSVSRIVKRLCDTGLLIKKDPLRIKGKVGQPSIPIALNPNGVFSVGVKIGRKSMDVLVIDFVGNILRQITESYEYPDPSKILPKVRDNISKTINFLNHEQRKRIVGIGVAAPYGLGDWPNELQGPPEVLRKWVDIDLLKEVSKNLEYPVWLEHDAKSACLADLTLNHQSQKFTNYLYIFVGTIIGGAVVLDGLLHRGSRGFAGAIGPSPVPRSFYTKSNNNSSPIVPLLQCASRYLLDEKLIELGFDPQVIVPLSGNDETYRKITVVRNKVDEWLENSSAAISIAILSSISNLDVEGVVVDGSFPLGVISELRDRIENKLNDYSFTGIKRPKLISGNLGNDARALGGAIIPLYWSFSPHKTSIF